MIRPPESLRDRVSSDFGDLHEALGVLERETDRRGELVRGARLEQGDLEVALQRRQRIAQLVGGVRREPPELVGGRQLGSVAGHQRANGQLAEAGGHDDGDELELRGERVHCAR